MLERHLPLEGTYNLRDVGGYATSDGRQIRWRTLFRADSLHRLSGEARSMLLSYGLRTVVDLRRPREREEWPNVFAALDDVRYVHVSIVPERDDLNTGGTEGSLEAICRVYRLVLDKRQAEIRRILGTLAEPEAFPAVVHCTAGKDRTGVIVALLLSLAGVPHETIAEDYALSATYLTGPYLEEARQRAEAAGYSWEDYRDYLVCPPEIMLRTLGHLDQRYGGVERYLLRIGLSEEEVIALRRALLADA